MKDSILEFLDLDVDGFVFGALKGSNEVDVDRTSGLIQLCEEKITVFHKAIDSTPDIAQASYALNEIGIGGILTSGGPGNAMDNLEILKLVIEDNPNLEVISAGKVTSENLQELHKILNGKAYHGKRIVGDLD